MPSAPGGGPPLVLEPALALHVPLGGIGIPTAPGGGPWLVELEGGSGIPIAPGGGPPLPLVELPLLPYSQVSPGLQATPLLHVPPSSPGPGF